MKENLIKTHKYLPESNLKTLKKFNHYGFFAWAYACKKNVQANLQLPTYLLLKTSKENTNMRKVVITAEIGH